MCLKYKYKDEEFPPPQKKIPGGRTEDTKTTCRGLQKLHTTCPLFSQKQSRNIFLEKKKKERGGGRRQVATLAPPSLKQTIQGRAQSLPSFPPEFVLGIAACVHRVPEFSRSPALQASEQAARGGGGGRRASPNFSLARKSSAGDRRRKSASVTLGLPSPPHAGSSSPGQKEKALFSRTAARAAEAAEARSPSPPRRRRLRGNEQGLPRAALSPSRCSKLGLRGKLASHSQAGAAGSFPFFHTGSNM